MTDQPQDQDPAVEAEQAAEEIATDGNDIRQRVRDLVVKLVQQRKAGLEKLETVAEQILAGAAKAVDDATPDEQSSVLRQVVDGLAEGMAKAANAAELAFEEAKSRGETFANEDVQSMIADLRALREMFVNTVTKAAGSLKSRAAEEASDLKTHAQRAAESIKPAVDSALRAATSQPGQLAKESAEAGVAAARQAAGALAHTLAGILTAAGDLLSGKEPVDKPEEQEKGQERE